MASNEASTATTTSSGPIEQVAAVVVAEIMTPSLQIGLKILFKGCSEKTEEGVHACSGYDGSATTPAQKEACHKAADALRGCLQVNVDMIKALAAMASVVDDGKPDSSAGVHV